MKIGQYLETYSKEKTEGINCNNVKCHFFDNSGNYMQNCSAGTRDDNSIVPYCMDYIPVKKYNLILADPPWKQKKGGKKKVRKNSSGKELDYSTMQLNEIENLLKKIFTKYSEDNTNYFIWTIDKYLTETDLMMQKFGYRRHARLIWNKIIGIPAAFTVRYAHEYLLWYYQGKHQPIAKEWRGKYSTVFREQVKKHSQKPDCIYHFLESIYPNAKKLELFARNKRNGWDIFGNEVKSDIEI